MGRAQPRNRPRTKQRRKSSLKASRDSARTWRFVRRTSSPASVHGGATTHQRFRPQSVAARAARPCLRSSSRCRRRGSVRGSQRRPTNVDRWGDRRHGGTPRPGLESRVRPHRLHARLAVLGSREEDARYRHRVCGKRLRIPMQIPPIFVCPLRAGALGDRHKGKAA
jgi:hypothetical protein